MVEIKAGDMLTMGTAAMRFFVMAGGEEWLPNEPVDVHARIYEELGDRTFYSYSDDHTMTLSDFIAELNDLASAAPKNSEVVIEICTESDYDGPSNPRYEVGYFRDPTEEEMAERRETNRKIAERDRVRAEQAATRERAEFERLKAKFDSDSDTRPKDGDAQPGSTRE